MEQDADLRDAMLDKLVVSIAERPVSVVQTALHYETPSLEAFSYGKKVSGLA